MRISYNMPALTMHLLQNQALNRQSTNLLNISSGYKINSTKDKPSGMVASQNMKLQIGGLQSASRNVQDGISMLQTAEGGLQEITSMIQRVRELAVQAGNGGTTEDDRQIMQNEIDQLLDGMNSMANGTEFNGLKLLSGDSSKTLKMQSGANRGENIEIPQINLTNTTGSEISQLYDIGTNGSTGSHKLVSNADIGDVLHAANDALDTVIDIRSKYGALENRFESSYDDLQDISNRTIGAESSLSDADIAEEIMNYTKEDIIVQASNAMIVQANKLPQDVLSILSNIK
ncbi:flagellin [Clostridium tyrobutyricum]|uniref:flagellin n=1 Tax=Clostridium tyrobutyricum TaxID=1519 RepID=UPI0018A06BFF|nr:flagellin [Clostridium tyrobutyricum]